MESKLPDGLGHPRQWRELVDQWLREEDPGRLERLFALADQVRRERVGDQVHLRGLIEFSNVCVRECTYCGLRRSNGRAVRYRMTRHQLLAAAARAHELGYGTVVLQSGEDDGSPRFLADVIKTIKRRYRLAVTLSVGERPPGHYRLWREKGADRVLLKTETSDQQLFRRIHPPRWPGEMERADMLLLLREMGYEIGGGIMVGIPGQTYKTLARDLQTFVELDLDMIGIGPYLPHPDTPLGRVFLSGDHATLPHQVPNTPLMTCKVIALARLLRPDANLPATTALATSITSGYELGLKRGANVIMPNLTPIPYQGRYDIYPRNNFKDPLESHQAIMESIMASGLAPGKGRGDRHRNPAGAARGTR